MSTRSRRAPVATTTLSRSRRSPVRSPGFPRRNDGARAARVREPPLRRNRAHPRHLDERARDAPVPRPAFPCRGARERRHVRPTRMGCGTVEARAQASCLAAALVPVQPSPSRWSQGACDGGGTCSGSGTGCKRRRARYRRRDRCESRRGRHHSRKSREASGTAIPARPTLIRETRATASRRSSRASLE